MLIKGEKRNDGRNNTTKSRIYKRKVQVLRNIGSGHNQAKR